MRRDLHRFFLAGIAVSTMLAILAHLVVQQIEFTLGTVLVCDVIVVGPLWISYRRRKQWRALFPDEDPLRSRELRCKMAKMIGRQEHRFV